MGPYAPKGTDKHFDWNDLKATVLAWQFWAFAAQYLAVRAPFACLAPLEAFDGSLDVTDILRHSQNR